MCLIKIEKTARVATAPIKVYKILSLDNRSPFQLQEYHVGKNAAINYNTFSNSGHTIEGGYLHAYLTESEARARLDILLQNAYASCTKLKIELKIVEMYIPTGTEYWLGEGLDVAAECLYWPEDKKAEDQSNNQKHTYYRPQYK